MDDRRTEQQNFISCCALSSACSIRELSQSLFLADGAKKDWERATCSADLARSPFSAEPSPCQRCSELHFRLKDPDGALGMARGRN